MKDAELFVENRNQNTSTIREASKTEIDLVRQRKMDIDHIDSQIKELTTKKQALEKNCNHLVVYDIAGWMYDERICFGCGKRVGLI